MSGVQAGEAGHIRERPPASAGGRCFAYSTDLVRSYARCYSASSVTADLRVDQAPLPPALTARMR